MKMARQEFVNANIPKDQRVTLGADPEVFITKGSARGARVIPVVGLLGGTKAAPITPFTAYEGYTVQEDNVMAEFNIPPAFSCHQFMTYISNARSILKSHLNEKHPDLGVGLSSLCAVEFQAQDLATPQASVFGCDPDYDAYNGGTVAPKVSPELLATANGGYRYAGGHVHMGWTHVPNIPPFVMAAMIDAYAYLPFVRYDKQMGRRSTYGAAGRYRPKPYGIEYRTPSNFWIHDMSMTEMFASNMFQVAIALSHLTPAYLQTIYQALPWGNVREFINSEEGTRAHQLYQTIVNTYPIGVAYDY